MAVKTRKTGKPTGRKVTKKTAGKRQTVKAKAKPKPPSRGARGHRGIIQGTSKEAVAKIFDAKGRDQAIEHGLKLGLAKSTLRTWCGTWKRDDQVSKPKARKTRKTTKPETGQTEAA